MTAKKRKAPAAARSSRRKLDEAPHEDRVGDIIDPSAVLGELPPSAGDGFDDDRLRDFFGD